MKHKDAQAGGQTKELLPSHHPDPRTVAGKARLHDRRPALLPVDIALEKGLAMARAVAETERVDLEHATNRVLAQALIAQAPLPRFDYSAMDGYAVRSADLAGDMPLSLKVVGRIAAGDRGSDQVMPPEPAAVRILTGAPIPSGADAVVAQEDVERWDDSIVLFRAPRPGENIRPCGEDARPGDVLLEAGTLLGPREIGVAASAGRWELEVFRKVRVAVFSTGSELRRPGETLFPGEIYESNRFMLRSLLERPWIDLLDLGSCPDDPCALLARMRSAAAQADIVLSTGGVSVGDEDHMPAVIRRCGGRLVVLNVAIKPGKPLTLGHLGDVLYVGLPGNPAAVFTTFCVVVEDLLRALAGLGRRRSPVSPAVADFDLTCRPGRHLYLPACRTGRTAEGVPVLRLLPNANSGKVVLLSKAEGFAVIDPRCEIVRPGDPVGWFPL